MKTLVIPIFKCWWWRFDAVPPADEPHVIWACTKHVEDLLANGWQPGAADMWRELRDGPADKKACLVCRGFDVVSGVS